MPAYIKGIFYESVDFSRTLVNKLSFSSVALQTSREALTSLSVHYEISNLTRL